MGTSELPETLLLPFDGRVALLAARQHGAFSRDQVKAIGGTKSMIVSRIDAGHWSPCFRNVFRLSGSAPTWRQTLMTVVLFWGNQSAASHRASAAIWELEGAGRRLPEITVPRDRQRTGETPGIVHRYALFPGDVVRRDGIPVTTVARTLIDLAGVVRRDELEEALDDALRRGLVTTSRVRARLQRLAGTRRKGIPVLRTLLDGRESGPVPKSRFETRVLRCLRQAGLPLPNRQYEIHDTEGLVGIADFAFPAERLVVEADGYRYHAGRIRWDRDRARGNRLTLLGWRVVNITWHELENDPARCADTVRRALEHRP